MNADKRRSAFGSTEQRFTGKLFFDSTTAPGEDGLDGIKVDQKGNLYLAVFTFLTTLTFLFSLPGWEKSLGGFPALSGSGGFLLKDVVLLGAALFTLGDSLAGNLRS